MAASPSPAVSGVVPGMRYVASAPSSHEPQQSSLWVRKKRSDDPRVGNDDVASRRQIDNLGAVHRTSLASDRVDEGWLDPDDPRLFVSRLIAIESRERLAEFA